MSHYDIHVGDVIKYPEMVMARTVCRTCITLVNGNSHLSEEELKMKSNCNQLWPLLSVQKQHNLKDFSLNYKEGEAISIVEIN